MSVPDNDATFDPSPAPSSLVQQTYHRFNKFIGFMRLLPQMEDRIPVSELTLL